MLDQIVHVGAERREEGDGVEVARGKLKLGQRVEALALPAGLERRVDDDRRRDAQLGERGLGLASLGRRQVERVDHKQRVGSVLVGQNRAERGSADLFVERKGKGPNLLSKGHTTATDVRGLADRTTASPPRALLLEGLAVRATDFTARLCLGHSGAALCHLPADGSVDEILPQRSAKEDRIQLDHALDGGIS